MTSIQIPYFLSSSLGGKPPHINSSRNAVKSTGRRLEQHKLPTGLNNPCISISHEDFEVTDANYDVLFGLMRSFGIEDLICERQQGWRIIFPDTLEGQRLVEECYRFLSGKRLQEKVLRVRKFDSGLPTKNLWFPLNSDCRRKHSSPARQHSNQEQGRTSIQLSKVVPRLDPHHESKARMTTSCWVEPVTSPNSKPSTGILMSPEANENCQKKTTVGAKLSWDKTTTNHRNDPADLQRTTQSPHELTSEPPHDFLSNEISCIPSAHSSLQPFRLHERRRMSVGSDEMSISSGPAVSDIPSTPSMTSLSKCCTCKKSEVTKHNPLVLCSCRRSYHAACHKPIVLMDQPNKLSTWLCAVCIKRERLQPSNIEETRDKEQAPPRRLPPWRLSGYVAETPPESSDRMGITKRVPYVFTGQSNENSRKNPEACVAVVTGELYTARSASQHGTGATPYNDGKQIVGAVRNPVSIVRDTSGHNDVTPSHSVVPLQNSRGLGHVSHSSRVSSSTQSQGRSVVATSPMKQSGVCLDILSRVDSTQYSTEKIVEDAAQRTLSNKSTNISNTEGFVVQQLGLPSSTIHHKQVVDSLDKIDHEQGTKNARVSKTFLSDSDSDLSSVPEEVTREADSESILQRPTISFNQMITAAIEESPVGQLDGKEVLCWIKDHYPFYKDNFPQKTLYSNVHALLSMGKNEGKFIKHEPPIGIRARCKYSLAPQRQSRLERYKSTIEKPQQYHQYESQQLMSSSLLTPQTSASANSSPGPRSRIDDPDDEDMPRTAGDIGYCVRNRTTSKYRVAAKHGMPEWETLPLLPEVEYNEMQLFTGDMVKVLLENTNDDFGKIFEIRRINENVIAVAILWYISTEDLQKITSHRNRREWPEGYKYLLTNWVDVINLKAIESKADAAELGNVFQGEKIVDCSGGTRLIREASAKEVCWVTKLIPRAFELMYDNMAKMQTTRISMSLPGSTLGIVPSAEIKRTLKSANRSEKRKREHPNSFITNMELMSRTTELENVGAPYLQTDLGCRENTMRVDGGQPKSKKRKLTNDFYPRPNPDITSDISVQEPGIYASKTKTKTSLPELDHGHPVQYIDAYTFTDTDDSLVKSRQLIAEKNYEIEKLKVIICKLQGRETTIPPTNNISPDGSTGISQSRSSKVHTLRSGLKRPQLGISDEFNAERVFQIYEHSIPSQSTDLKVLRVESNERFRSIAILKTLFQKQSTEMAQLKKEIKASNHIKRGYSASTEDGYILLGKTVVVEKFVYDQKLSDWRETVKLNNVYHCGVIPHDAPHLKKEKKKFFGKPLPMNKTGAIKYGETPCDELREILGIPNRHVLFSHNGVLSYRDDTRAADGSLLHPQAIFPVNTSTNKSSSDPNSIFVGRHA